MRDVGTRARSRVLVAVAAVLSMVAIGVLWPLQQPHQICPAIYPAPPGCAGSPLVAPLVGIALVLALLASVVVVYFTARDPWLPIALLTIGIVLAVVFTTAISVGGQNLGWTVIPETPPYPLEERG